MSGQNHLAPKAMILAAGNGTRLRPLTVRMPKAMVPLGGRPLLEHTVELLQEHGVRDIAINLHAHAAVIADHFGDGSRFGVNLTYSFEPRLLGTAGAVKKLEGFFKDGPFFVVYGDVLSRLDLNSLLDYHCARGAKATIALYQATDPASCGIVEQDGNDWITSFVEKPESGISSGAWANAGMYVVEPSLLDQIEGDAPQDFGRDVFPKIAGNGGGLAGFRSGDVFWDVGTADRLRLAGEWLRTGSHTDQRATRIGEIAGGYLSSVHRALAGVDLRDVSRVAELILDARLTGNQVFIAGNGGSAATASHMASDLSRAAMDSTGPQLKCRCLTDNVPALTALSNDIGYESALAKQIEQFAEPGDVLIAISASGQSPNILAAVNSARKAGASVVGLVGFGGGSLAKVADVAVLVPNGEYGPVEDIHLFLNHLLATVVREAAEPVESARNVEELAEAVPQRQALRAA